MLTSLTGWGACIRADCVLAEPDSPHELVSRLDHAGTIARGLGRSYGDPALNADGQVLRMTRIDRYLGFDESTGTLRCEAGVSLERIIQDFTPRGWFPMITPGTKFVTVGGCIANDVHGKAHHAQGSFAGCVDAMTVLLADGRVVRATREENADLFWASFGGMGLLGVILTADIRLRKIETSYFKQQTISVNNLEHMLEALEQYDHQFPYSVATIDVFAKGAQLGRGTVNFGDHAALAELPAALAKHALRVSGPPKIAVPFELPEFTLNPLSMRVVNAAISYLLRSKPEYDHYEQFFYPLDMFGHWNRAYGRRGFTQYQFVIPFEDGARRMRALLETVLAAGELPFLNILKRMGKESGGVLSFPREGLTFAIDFPIRNRTVEVLRKLDRMVLDAGGRIYLGKDAYVDADTFREMYPAVERWRATKAKYDPTNVFTSNLARRVGLECIS